MVAVARFEREQALREELRDAQTKLIERKVIERGEGISDAAEGRERRGGVRLLRAGDGPQHQVLDIARQIVDVAKLLG